MKVNNSLPVGKIAIGLLLASAFAVVSYLDSQDEMADAGNYCQMVAVWKAEEARGIAPNDRSGWPPFNGECLK